MRRVHYPGWSVLDGFKLKDRNVTMLLPELVESHWYYYLSHNNRPEANRGLLLLSGNLRITVVSSPYRLHA
jgi:hypothetical protein